MDARKAVLREAMDFIDEGNHSLSGLLEHLADDSPLREAADKTGFGVSDTLINILEESGWVWVDEDTDLVVETDDLLDGLVLTHRLTADELERELVDATPDLNLLFLPDDLVLAGGGDVRLVYDWGPHSAKYHAHGSLTGYPGWLDGFSAGDTVAFIHGRDGLRMERVSELGDGAAEVDAISRVFKERWADRPGAGFDTNVIVDKAVMRNLDLFRRPVPPIAELLDAAGLEIEGMWVGPKGELWEPGYVRLALVRALRLADEQGLAQCCTDWLEIVVSYAMGREVEAGETNTAVSHGAVADAFIDWWRDLRELEHRDFGDLARELIDAGGRNLAGARYLLALHHDARGDAVAAERQLEQTIQDDLQHPPSRWMLAGYASDRGDLRRAVSLYRRSGEDPEEGVIPFLEQLQVSFDDVGRNDPCPCGSGRKFKRCHLLKPAVPDRQRVSWMVNKVHRYVNAHHRHDAIAGLVVDALGEGLDVDEFHAWCEDDFVQDIAIFEDGGLERFIHDRADMLPDDEVEIFRVWTEEPLRCWELVASDGDHLVTLRDTATGDTVEMRDDIAARDVAVGELILTRALPAFGVRWPSLAWLTVDPELRDELHGLLDGQPDPEVWVGWYETLIESAPPPGWPVAGT